MTAAAGLQGFDFMKILDCGLDVVEARRNADGWHSAPAAGERYEYHASGLTKCARAAVLTRAGLATDGVTRKGRLNFMVGHAFHDIAQAGAEAFGGVSADFELVGAELEVHHKTLPLCARADLVARWKGELVLFDWKTEHELAAKRRTADAAKNGRIHAARPEHVLQVVATAMCVEDTLGEPVTAARVAYVTKSNLWPSQEVIDVQDTLQRREVERLIHRHEVNWSRYVEDGNLPPLLDQRDPELAWLCKPRSGTDGRGQWCAARSTCFAAAQRGA